MRILCAARALAVAGALFSLVAPTEALAQGAPKVAAKPKPAAAKPGAGKAPAKPIAKAPAAAAAKGGNKKGGGGKKAPRKPGAEAGQPDEATRRIIAGTSGHGIHESPELKAMRELDLALFPSNAAGAGAPWLAEGSPLVDRGEPRLLASGLPPQAPIAAQSAEPAPDLAWLRQLAMPDIPVRWDGRVVRYLEYYKNNPRGRSMVQSWLRRSGRYGGSIRRILREQNLPEDIVWLALVESGFDASISSPVGAAGLWQFMPEGARIYGLTVDRWIDERLDPERSTLAAARYLADLRQRFGGWELAFAAYNMGYGGLLASIRKYNTNDFWELSRLESGMPLETALYVPKIVAMAIVARNKAIFGCDDLELDPAINFDKVAVGSGVSLRALALASGTSVEKLEELNPQMLASRAPPLSAGDKSDLTWSVRVPAGAAPKAAKSLSAFVDGDGKLDRYTVRWGESLEDIAQRRGVARYALQSLNGVRRDESLRPGTVIFVPASAASDVYDAPSGKPTVVVPAQAFTYLDRERVFYRVIPGDTLRAVASVFSVSPDEISRWNAIDPSAALHDGMTLQIFTPKDKIPTDALVLAEKDAMILASGTPEFVAHFESLRGRSRVEVVAKQGDTWRTVAGRYGLSMGQMERINHRSRTSPLCEGDRCVVYVPTARAADVAKRSGGVITGAPDEAPAVTKPVEEDVASTGAAKDDEGTSPAVLIKPGATASPAPIAP
jgi:membrane-bound lytic murein transglycosylase D